MTNLMVLFNKLYNKHLQNINLKYDDDSALFTKSREKIITINGHKNNLKITYSNDISTRL